jgi:PRC-barrel domain
MGHLQETSTLIAGDKVSGTNVFNMAGENIGEIRDVMIDKSSGRIAYAVMSFGGLLGIGEKYHPMPWALLEYDPARGGYVVDISPTQLEGGPVYDKGKDPGWNSRDFETRLHDYYGSEPYWMPPF